MQGYGKEKEDNNVEGVPWSSGLSSVVISSLLTLSMGGDVDWPQPARSEAGPA